MLSVFNHTWSQEVCVCKQNGEIYKVDFQICTTTLLCDVNIKDVAFDLTFHPNGKLYIISYDGKLNEVNKNNGTITLVHDFGGQIYTSLVTDANGIFYATGDKGLLFTYDMKIDKEDYLGDIGYSAAGDLTFFNGNLYMAAINNKLVQIDINDPSNSFVIMNIKVSNKVYGIFSYGNKCGEIEPYLAAEDDIYKIDFLNKSLQFICKFDFGVAGGASTFEFYGSNPIEIHSISKQDPICSKANGTLTVIASGGIGKLQYSIDGINYGESIQFSGLPEGAYTIFVRDQNGCYVTETIVLSSDQSIKVNVTKLINASCNQNNGSIVFYGTGGIGNFEYSLDGQNFRRTGAFDSLGSGTYKLFVQDGNGCIAKENVTIGQTGIPGISIFNKNDATCDQDNGSITILGSGGSGIIQYSLDGLGFQAVGTFTNLKSGIYAITVKDESGCATSQNVSITQWGKPQIQSIFQSDATCDLDNGMLNIIGSSGYGELNYSINGNTFSSSGKFSDLQAGPYSIYIKDKSNCTLQQNLLIVQTGKPRIIDIPMIQPSCNQNNGQIKVVATGGSGPLMYSLNKIDFQAFNLFPNLQPGNYTLIVKDSTKCTTMQDVILAEENSIKISKIYVESESCGNSNGTIKLLANGGKGALKYSLNHSFEVFDNYFTQLGKGEYNIRIRDSLNCEADTTVFLNRNCDVFLPNVFSPNGDGINDYFSIFTYPNTEAKIVSINIFDRWGNTVFGKGNFLINGNENLLWDGKFNGKELDNGVYVYKIKVLNSDHKFNNIIGEVSLFK